MVVFRENPRIYHTDAPTRQAVSNQVDQQRSLWGDTWECAQDAAKNLLRLFQDAATTIAAAKRINPAPAEGAFHLDDVKDLLRLGYWLIHCPMWKIIAERRRRLAASFPEQADTAFIWNLISIEQTMWTIQSLIFSVQISQLPLDGRYTSLQSDIPQWTNVNNATAQNITVLGFMELLLRIVAHTSPNLATLYASMNALRSRQPRLQGDNQHRGLPRVLFICAGTNVGRFVITTTKDHWYDFTSLYNMCDAARDARRRAPPVVRPNEAGPAFDVQENSKRVYTELQKSEKDVKQILTNNACEQIRRATIEYYQSLPGGGKVANHANERFLALRCPDFSIKARCLRCQALFRYRVDHPDAGRLVQAEWDWRGDRVLQLKRLCQKDWSCAETLAHFYCEAANHTHQGGH